MPYWPFARRESGTVTAVPPGSIVMIEETLRGSMQDLFAARERQAQGYTLSWSGELLQPPARALRLLEARFKPYGYTPFLNRDKAGTWVRAVPLAVVGERSRLWVTVALFVLTVLSTLAAGCFFATGSIPFFDFNPLRSPGRLLSGLPFAITLLAILGTHEFGHYFTARGVRRLGQPAVLHPGAAAPVPVRHAGSGDPDALARARSQLAVRHRGGGAAGGSDRRHPRRVAGARWSYVAVVPPGAGMTFGDSILMRVHDLSRVRGHPRGMDVIVHPMALAGWVGSS